ncbi:MAG: hypothetical protein KIT63_05485 [Rhodoferax sp.]|nr:hypothetical protein [Rhodoferax sp.]
MQFDAVNPLPTLDGPPPWPREKIEHVALWNRQHALDKLHEHPARKVKERQESIKSMLRLLNKTAETFTANINTYHDDAHNHGLYTRPRDGNRRILVDEIREGLYIFTCCAITLADQTRPLSELVQVPGYEEKKDEAFATNPRHRFLQELRNDVVHVKLHDLGWELFVGRNNVRQTTCKLLPDRLTRSHKYNPEAKKFLADNPNGIDLGVLVTEYREQVNQFHCWMEAAMPNETRQQIQDHDQIDRAITRVATRKWWELVLSQMVINANRDPYAYLDRYLTPDEHRTVLQLPHKSSAQVDKIIELVDEDGACNVELRSLAYKAFGVLAA